MKLTVLVDNNTIVDRYFQAEPGVSYLIEAEGKRILFDVGYTGLFIKNARKMNLNLLKTDFLVLSHGHLDHTWGLTSLIRLYTEAAIEKINYNKPTLVAHPSTFSTKLVNDSEEIGSVISREGLSRHFETNLSKVPLWLTEKLIFLGEIERNNQFEAKLPIGKTIKSGLVEDDYVLDDSALVYNSEEGLIIVTGCSHAGICNIIEYARKVCKEERIVDIVGGFHLLNPPKEQLNSTLEYLRRIQPKKVHACHCTDLNSKIALAKVVNLEEVGVGLSLEYK